jgi:DNA-binding NarL/FixJ family response regulator
MRKLGFVLARRKTIAALEAGPQFVLFEDRTAREGKNLLDLNRRIMADTDRTPLTAEEREEYRKKFAGAIEQAIQRNRPDADAAARRAAIRERFASMTPRETEVMTFVVGGYLNKQIAAELGVALKTIKVHRGRVMEKMLADSVADLVRMAQELDIAPLTHGRR